MNTATAGVSFASSLSLEFALSAPSHGVCIDDSAETYVFWVTELLLLRSRRNSAKKILPLTYVYEIKTDAGHSKKKKTWST